MPSAVSGQTSPAVADAYRASAEPPDTLHGLLLDLVRVYEAQAARYSPAVEPGWLDSNDAGGDGL